MDKNKSKQLSYILRHHPESIGLNLEDGGWGDVSVILIATKFTQFELNDIVENNDKKRFEFNSDKTKIRARQGHSLDINLQYLPAVPPDVLYHGTAAKAIELIKFSGIQKMNRHHVHLSNNYETAFKVGQRHGKPIVLNINAKLMYNYGMTFYKTENDVWLTDYVPANMLI